MSGTFRDLLGGDAAMAVRVLLPVRNIDTGQEMTWREFLDAAGREGTTLSADSDWGELSHLSGTGIGAPVPRCHTAQGAVPPSIIATLEPIVTAGGHTDWHGLSRGPAFTPSLTLRGTFGEVTRFWAARGLSGHLSREDGAVHFSQPPYADCLLLATTREIARTLLDSGLEAFQICCPDAAAPRMTL